MTTTPTQRLIEMSAPELADLYRGYLQAIAHLGQGWAVGLIWGDGARERDAAFAEWMQRTSDVLWLAEEQLHEMATGRPVAIQGRRACYLVVVDDVEQLEELLADGED